MPLLYLELPLYSLCVPPPPSFFTLCFQSLTLISSHLGSSHPAYISAYPQSFPVLFEKDGAKVCHVQFTILLKGAGSDRITGTELDIASVCDLNVDEIIPEDIKAILALSVKKKKKKKKKNKSDGAAE